MKNDELIKNLVNIASQLDRCYCISLTMPSATKILIQPIKRQHMTTEITKDEQIKNQSTTIQSLERKVESLEAELQKCLNLEDDSDTTRNAQADSFPKLSADQKQTMVKRTLSKASEIMRGCLGITSCFDNSETWQTLRNAMIADEKLDGIRSDKFFKYGLQILMYITDAMIEAKAADDEYLQKKESWLVRQLLADHDEGDHESLLKLIEAFEIVAKDPEHARRWGLNPQDVNDLRIDLTTIARCHRMVLDAHRKRK
jgi:hypothetical protein